MNYFIKGRVQGVGYRAFARRAAQQLGLSGWARNLSDGRVEVRVSGSSDLLARYEKELKKGPGHGKVDEIESRPSSPESFVEFLILEEA